METKYKIKSKSLLAYENREIMESLPEIIDKIFLRLEELENDSSD